MANVVVVGAGIAGLSFAYEALKCGHRVTLVEKQSQVGGLCRSFEYNQCYLDMGVHLLHLRDKQVYEKIKEIVPQDQWVKVVRNGKLYLKGRYINWPLNMGSLLQFPIMLGIQACVDQLKLRLHPQKGFGDYESEMKALYGNSLYDAFFGPLTEKFLKTTPSDVHADWAFSSLRAATKIEDKSFNDSYRYLQTTDQDSKRDFNLLSFIINSFKADLNNEDFYYFRDGFGTMVNAYEQKIKQMGGQILLDSQVTQIDCESGKIRGAQINGQSYDVDHLAWTGNLFNLCELLNIPFSGLKYLHSQFVYAFLGKPTHDHQVCYYADQDVSFVRGTVFSNHSKTIIRNPKVKDIICLEYTFSELSSDFYDVERMKELAIKDLVKTKMVRDAADVQDVCTQGAPYSYPILDKTYHEKLAQPLASIGKIENLITLGRQGTFGYENSDVIIKEAINHPLFSKKEAVQQVA